MYASGVMCTLPRRSVTLWMVVLDAQIVALKSAARIVFAAQSVVDSVNVHYNIWMLDSWMVLFSVHQAMNMVQSISCSKDCRCSEMCTNRPFRKEKKIKVAKTEYCGWGVEAAEPIKEGDFVTEYVGEVIDDALCVKRLWHLKSRGDENFYLCEIRKNFTIDATYKGNFARFVNHSCDPNCRMEKWEVDGETRVGIFAMRSIKVGEPLTYDYRFVCFGSDVECHCGASNCHGTLGTRRKIYKLDSINLSWCCKRRRSKLCSEMRNFL
ncbi:hypothetical protein IFM89_026475 [Coptis chinensis]|uniref:Uncharacterized protein n=1 Tax=Coptis chinensis TaxID=261450 RepID=A0A835M6P6_9MAGN|nr:hypothetical protein IFM89_026475 [Coptis chinensis]